jgi:hypothetical protein
MAPRLIRYRVNLICDVERIYGFYTNIPINVVIFLKNIPQSFFVMQSDCVVCDVGAEIRT